MQRTPAPGVVNRSRGRLHPCDVPAPPHSLTYTRLYACGWRCDRHSPAAMADWPALPAAAQTRTRQDDHDG